MDSTEKVFKALGNGSRRAVLDCLFARDGQTLGELCQGAMFSRQAAWSVVLKRLQYRFDKGPVDWDNLPDEYWHRG